MGTAILGGSNMQMCYSLRCKQIDMSTADRLISNLRNDNATPPLIYEVKFNAIFLKKNLFVTFRKYVTKSN